MGCGVSKPGESGLAARKTIHQVVAVGDQAALQEHIDSGTSVNSLDSIGVCEMSH